jgi:hypothetical protein
MSTKLISKILNDRVAGNIALQMKSYAKLETINDGTHYYGQIDIQAEEPSFPCLGTSNMMLRLTDKSFSITQFTESFITIELEVELLIPKILDTDPPLGSDTEELLTHQFLFVGLKSSNEIFHDYQIYHKNLPINDTQQQNTVYEHFLYSTFKAGTEKDNKKYVHSQYKDISRMDTSACGVFIPLIDIQRANNNRFTVHFPVSIPYRDI